MEADRTPDLTENTFDGMLLWFAEMSRRELLFHPEDSPSEIVNIRTGEPTFSAGECDKIDRILSGLFGRFGDGVHEAACPVFMKRFGGRLDA
jgi:hypothetical protein